MLRAETLQDGLRATVARWRTLDKPCVMAAMGIVAIACFCLANPVVMRRFLLVAFRPQQAEQAATESVSP
jgi:hypothetical protein